MHDKDRSPIFILSCARSGSTLLRLLLDAHPDIAAPPELHLLELGKRLLWTYRFTSRPQDSLRPDNSAWDVPINKTRAALDTIMAEYCEHRSKARWCEKSITSLQHLDVLNEVFPDAKIVLLYRQCLDVAASGLEAIEKSSRGFDFDQHLAFHRSDPRIAMVEYWYDRASRLWEFQGTAGQRAQMLKYEDLVTAPEATLEKLADFLDVDWNPDLVQLALEEPEHIGPGDEKAYGKHRIAPESVGRGARVNWAGVPRSLLKKVAILQAELGYPDRGTALN